MTNEWWLQRSHSHPIHRLSAEVLEIIFQKVDFKDLKSISQVCKFWAEIAERPQLWADFRLVINQHNHGAAEKILSWKKFSRLKSLTVEHFSERVAKAVRRHQRLQRLHFNELAHYSFYHSQVRVPSLVNCFIDPEDLDTPFVGRVKEMKLTNCYLPCGQMWKILSAIVDQEVEGKNLSLERLVLGNITSHYSSNHNSVCPVPASMLGQAASRLRALSIHGLPFDGSQWDHFFKALSTPESKLQELTISEAPTMVDLDPSILASVLTIPGMRKVTLNAVNLGLLQTRLFMEKIAEGNLNLKLLSINYDSFNNKDNKNRVKAITAPLLARAINQLERVKFGNVNLSSDQVEQILLQSKEKTKLKELWVDRYDADRSHIFLPLELTNSLSFDFNFNDIQCYVKWEEGWKTSVNNEGAFFEDLSEEDLWSCPF